MTTYLVYGAPRGAKMHAIDFAKLVAAGELVTVCNLIHATTWVNEGTVKEVAELLRNSFPKWKFEVRKQG